MSFNFKKYKDELLFVPLGGSNEIGMNLNLYHVNGKWLMVDCGIGFANDYLPGVEIMVPDIAFLEEIKDDLLGLVLTHAHEDHLGGVPYLWREFECPIYATGFTATFLRNKIQEMGPGKRPEVNVMKQGDTLNLGPFSIEMVDLTHSIPEMQALAITTPKGVIMHTGDWKFDGNPLIGPVSDYETLQKYGDGKVLAMVCDSTNVFERGDSGSEGDVRAELVKLIAECPQRVLVTTFASNVARLSSLIMAAHEAGRVIALAGRSLWRIVECAKATGYLDKDIEFLSDRDVMNLPRKDAFIISTGCQGEPRAALTRIAAGTHQSIRLAPGDTVVFSARKIPGNESRINWMMNKLVERGVEVITGKDHFIHVSGHPARDELKKMYELVRPQIAVPTHGEFMHLHEHCAFAKAQGVKETVQAKNGAVIWLERDEASVIGQVESGYLAIEGNGLISTESSIIRMRRKLRDDGIIFASVVWEDKKGLAAPVHLSAPGVLDVAEDQELLDEWAAEATAILEKAKPRATDTEITDSMRKFLRRITGQDIAKKPVIEVQIIRV